MEINERTRARTIWVLVAVAAAYSLVNVILFYTTNSFGPVWFAASIAVYIALGIVAVTLAFVDTGVHTVRHTHNVHRFADDANGRQGPTRERLVFENNAGRVLEEQQPSPRKRDLYVETAAGLRPVDEIEAELDQLRTAETPNDVPLRELESALDELTLDELHNAYQDDAQRSVEVTHS